MEKRDIIMIKNIFFDLDGTLLPLDMQKFMSLYFKSITESVCPYVPLDPQTVEKAILAGLDAMYKNNGEITNKMRFWNTVATVTYPRIVDSIPIFNGYYENEFLLTKEATATNPLSAEIVEILKKKGYKLVVATNPFFPKIGTVRRVKWAGVNEEDFEYITTYENSKYSKPNPKYFTETCISANCRPEETLMVGNDVEEDMSAKKVGLDTYLVTDCLVNRKNEDISAYKHGTMKDFYQFCLALPDIKNK